MLEFMLGFIGFGGTELFRRELMRMMEMMPNVNSNPVRAAAAPAGSSNHATSIVEQGREA